MRKLLVLVLLLAGLLAGSSYWCGQHTEERYQALLAQLSHNGPVTFSDAGYRRGLFRSEARTAVSLPQPDGPPLRLVLLQRIWHGPFPLGLDDAGSWHFGPLLAFVQTTVATDGDNAEWRSFPPLAGSYARTAIRGDGGATLRLTLAPWRQSRAQDTQLGIDWQGLEAVISFSGDLRSYSGTVTLPNLQAETRDGTFQLKAGSLGLDIHTGPDGLALGDLSFAADELTAVPGVKSARTVTLGGISMHESASAAGDAVDYGISLGLDSIRLGDAEYGPGGFELHAKHLDARALQALRLALERSELRSGDATDQSTARQADYRQALADLLNHDPTLELRFLSLKTADGEFWARGSAKMASGDLGGTQDFSALRANLSAEGELLVSKALLKTILTARQRQALQADRSSSGPSPAATRELETLAARRADAQIESLTSSGQIVTEGDSYRSFASFNGGRLHFADTPPAEPAKP